MPAVTNKSYFCWENAGKCFGLLCFLKATNAYVVFIRWGRVLAVWKVKVQMRKFVEVNI